MFDYIYYEIDGVTHESTGEIPEGGKILSEKDFIKARVKAQDNASKAMTEWYKENN